MKPKKNPVTGRFEGFGIDQALRSFILDKISVQPQTTWELAKQIKQATGKTYSDAALSARCRDLRKKKYGSHTVRCVPIETSFGTRWEYSVPHKTFEDRQYPLTQSA